MFGIGIYLQFIVDVVVLCLMVFMFYFKQQLFKCRSSLDLLVSIYYQFFRGSFLEATKCTLKFAFMLLTPD